MDIGFLKTNPLLTNTTPSNQVDDYDAAEYMKNEYRVDFDRGTQVLQIDGKMMLPVSDKLTSGIYFDGYSQFPGMIYGRQPEYTNPIRQTLSTSYFQPHDGFFGNLGRIEKDSAERRHVCRIGDCGRKFKRLEHLKRHQRIHSGERPFCCPIPGCEKKFSRSDNLTQHVRVHLNDPAVAHAADYYLRMRKISTSGKQ